MTNEQAIKILQTYFECRRKEDGGYCDGECHECELVQKAEDIEQAYNMAIMALKTSCDNCPLSADGDLISRKAVLDKLQENQDFYINAYGDRFDFRDLAPKDEKARVDEITTIQAFIVELPTIPQTDLLDVIKAEIDNESIGYPPSADYYKAIKKAVRIIEKHISGKENE